MERLEAPQPTKRAEPNSYLRGEGRGSVREGREAEVQIEIEALMR